MSSIDIIDKDPSGLVFSIQGHSVHDGPGTRTTVFMNGCPLNCIWCCNPEGLFHKPVLMHSDVKCKKCGACIEACPHGAVKPTEDGSLFFDREICNRCSSHECIEACYHEGNSISGKYYSVEDLMKIFTRDRMFWGERGGVTFSGGEPLLQKNFMLPMLKKCKESYIHVTLETTADLEESYFFEAIKYVDWMFFDLKHMNPVKHKELTGRDNKRVLNNIRKLAEAEWWNGFAVPRIPIIPDCNDSEENIRETAKFIKELDLELINILPFHRLGESKYRQVGQSYKFEDVPSPGQEKMEQLKKVVEAEGLMCFVGHNTPF